MMHSMWSTSYDDIVSAVSRSSNKEKKKSKKKDSVHKSKEKSNLARTSSSLSSDSGGSKSEKVSVKARMQTTIKKLWSSMFVSLL